ncbi:hypothetical protein A3D80_00165 [Candidatus Roizmanbacteria bacterium RIFCSPHIGHO2_02_FULL_40_13b]|uniref:Rod shape-determining protein RodA n=1 Tax=Candidatus Roizmanbacteria bacterium RIFCSPHIGHO2_01_FULL_39_24 TaxID=1802032 RepID=A0A1F7GFH4_9BACT|nr:MAG: hypothetical protein A2799_04810 [Candidatus Roizmanbacteria bacterium RIFCSPHIGHO2_01_FULL_39_24]OGK28050.1 MAG: hypothetical protein A3D80_00165 [Candidatus Roizmanbacteria bacterium RIFCSPHIGHO2_02_FULL_40_13b]OGK49559.1 MAG: hypothetical protein A3A56_04135 [Candidatus Roizmanbacteria bacterium RIFCSPLOWO2_01_FULL_40_32]
MTTKIDGFALVALIGLALFSLFNLLGISFQFFLNQFTFFIVGFIALFLTLKLGIKNVQINARLIYLSFIGLLIITFIVGDVVRGSRRWIDLVFFNFQASEFLKPFFIIFLADFFSKSKISTRSVLISFAYFLLIFVIIVKQPDLGNALLYLGVFAGMVFFAGLTARYYMYAFILSIITSPILWKLLKDYQKNRILSFLNPQIDTSGISYNLIQSIITVGSGGLFGRGLGLGTQSRFLFLPENHTDFAYAALVEQFGFIGGLAVIILYAILFYRLLLVLRSVRDNPFHFMYVSGVLLFLATSFTVNIGMNMGLFPITGIALPFVSYGGSSVVSTMIMVGLALSLNLPR